MPSETIVRNETNVPNEPRGLSEADVRITVRRRDTNRSCCPVSRSRNISAWHKISHLSRDQDPGLQARIPSTRPLTAAFPEDEPLFAKTETDQQPATHEPNDEPSQDKAIGAAANAQVGSSEWDREQKRLHEMNVAAVFGGTAAEPAQVRHDEHSVTDHEHSNQIPVVAATEGTIEEEVIEEEEADLASYVDDLEEDAAFEELEEETREAGKLSRTCDP